MQEDRTEQYDLAKEQPDRLTKMVTQWQEWANRVGVQDWPFKNKPRDK